MEHELVIKFWRKSLTDELFLSTIQSDVMSVLGDSAEFNGYDVSESEINVFIAADPARAFRRVKRLLEDRNLFQGVSAASRLVGGAKFTSIWPHRAMRPFKLP